MTVCVQLYSFVFRCKETNGRSGTRILPGFLRISINFYKKLCFPVISWNEAFIGAKRFSQLLLLKDSESFLFRQRKKLVCFGLCGSPLVFQRSVDQVFSVCKK